VRFPRVAQDTTFEFERRRNRPERYDRNLVGTTLKVRAARAAAAAAAAPHNTRQAPAAASRHCEPSRVHARSRTHARART
jgi:hypothetical protein